MLMESIVGWNIENLVPIPASTRFRARARQFIDQLAQRIDPRGFLLVDAHSELRLGKTQQLHACERVEAQIEFQVHRHVQWSGIRLRLSNELRHHSPGTFLESRMLRRSFPANG